MGWFADLWARWFGDSRPSGPIGAAELMQEMKAARRGAPDPAAWTEGLATLRSRVYSASDRARLWRRARRRHPGEVRELALIEQPDAGDLEALEALLRELERA